ncbi:hypothetical protein NMG60_11008604 [Bertholletia excelsa]
MPNKPTRLHLILLRRISPSLPLYIHLLHQYSYISFLLSISTHQHRVLSLFEEDMPEAKQPHLNGAFYGPSIPPSNTYHRPGRGGGCGCCGCLCGCLFTLLCEILLSIIVVVGLAAFCFWLIFRPNRVKFHVTDASLSQFDFNTTTNNLRYNMSLTLAIRNPNKYIGIYYNQIEARAFYEGQRFDSITFPSFYQGHENTTNLNLVFDGQQYVLLQGNDLSDFNSDKSSGSYSIRVKLYLRVKFKLRAVKTPRFKPRIKCKFDVPLNGKASGTFEAKRCDLDLWHW